MSELIDRQAVIEKFAMTAPQMSVIRIYEAVEILESMPTIQLEPQWIPVSERLPEEPGYYITSNEYNGVGEDFYYDCHFWNADKNAYSVIAWMPFTRTLHKIKSKENEQ